MLNKKNKFLKFQNRNFSINSKKVKKNDIFLQLRGLNSQEIYTHQKLYQEEHTKLSQVKI